MSKKGAIAPLKSLNQQPVIATYTGIGEYLQQVAQQKQDAAFKQRIQQERTRREKERQQRQRQRTPKPGRQPPIPT